MKGQRAIVISAFYKFVPLTEGQALELRERIETYAESIGLRGLILIACEGINATVAGTADTVKIFKEFLLRIDHFSGLPFKDSSAEKIPFRRLMVQFREEIVTLKNGIGIPDIKPSNRLSPKEWNDMLQAKRDEIAIIDVRNDYEVEIGRFKGAIDPKLKRFSQFPDFVRTSNIPKDKPVLMYCTGGIRCEKAIEEMYAQGYQEVYQLDGGILKHFEECPHTEFEGECFVFDHRVSVDQNLQPTQKFKLCPHCGNPGTKEIVCSNCDAECVVCVGCAEDGVKTSCSKNCAYHLKLKKGGGQFRKTSNSQLRMPPSPRMRDCEDH